MRRNDFSAYTCIFTENIVTRIEDKIDYLQDIVAKNFFLILKYSRSRSLFVDLKKCLQKMSTNINVFLKVFDYNILLLFISFILFIIRIKN